MAREPVAVTEIFKALSDPIRWSIIQQVAREEEFACSVLEDTLPISKPTISYHTKILTQAGLIEVRKRGRNYFYTLRREVLAQVLDELVPLAPPARQAPDAASGEASSGGSRPADRSDRTPPADQGPALLTW